MTVVVEVFRSESWVIELWMELDVSSLYLLDVVLHLFLPLVFICIVHIVLIVARYANKQRRGDVSYFVRQDQE